MYIPTIRALSPGLLHPSLKPPPLFPPPPPSLTCPPCVLNGFKDVLDGHPPDWGVPEFIRIVLGEKSKQPRERGSERPRSKHRIKTEKKTMIPLFPPLPGPLPPSLPTYLPGIGRQASERLVPVLSGPCPSEAAGRSFLRRPGGRRGRNGGGERGVKEKKGDNPLPSRSKLAPGRHALRPDAPTACHPCPPSSPPSLPPCLPR